MANVDLYLEAEDLLYFESNTNNIKVDKWIFDDFIANTYINICFVENKREDKGENKIEQYIMVSEDDEGIFMEWIDEL